MQRVIVLVVLVATVAAGCAKKAAPATPAPPPNVSGGADALPPAPPQRVEERLPVPPQPLSEDGVGGRSLDDLNRNSPLKPVFFALDAFDLDNDGRAVVAGNAEILKRNQAWMVTIEGHCDERGTAEYNLALGERRAVAVRTYLISLGIPADRIRTVSYGKEFPFDPGHDEAAWSKNRRAHFVITAN